MTQSTLVNCIGLPTVRIDNYRYKLLLSAPIGHWVRRALTENTLVLIILSKRAMGGELAVVIVLWCLGLSASLSAARALCSLTYRA